MSRPPSELAWLQQALRDPSLSDAASVLLLVMDCTGTSAAAAAAAAATSEAPDSALNAHTAAAVQGAGKKLFLDSTSSIDPSGSCAPMASDKCAVDNDLEKTQQKRTNIGQGNQKKRQRVAEPTPAKLSTDGSLQAFLDDILSGRGYSTRIHTCFECGYNTKPTILQRASYGTAVLAAVRRSDARALSALLSSGLSRNPSSAFSDDILHITCKRGEYELVKAQLDAGGSVHVANDLGRTPLHHAAWAGHRTSFRVVEALLDRDPRLLKVADKAGRTPLHFVAAGQRESWVGFLESKKDAYWPEREKKWSELDGPPVVVRPAAAEEGVMPDPGDAFPIELATLVASGQVDPREVASMRNEVGSMDVQVGPIVKEQGVNQKKRVSMIPRVHKAVSASYPSVPSCPVGQDKELDYYVGKRTVANRMA